MLSQNKHLFIKKAKQRHQNCSTIFVYATLTMSYDRINEREVKVYVTKRIYHVSLPSKYAIVDQEISGYTFKTYLE